MWDVKYFLTMVNLVICDCKSWLSGREQVLWQESQIPRPPGDLNTDDSLKLSKYKCHTVTRMRGGKATALWVKLCWKVVIGEFTKMIPSAPFLSISIVSDKIFGDCPLSSFTFDIYLGTSWTQLTAEEGFTIESVSIQADCWKDVVEIFRTSWM